MEGAMGLWLLPTQRGRKWMWVRAHVHVCARVALCSDSLRVRQDRLLGKELGGSEVAARERTAELEVLFLGVLCLLTSSLAKHLPPLFFSLPPRCGLQVA